MRFICLVLGGWLACAWSVAQTPKQRTLAIISRVEPASIVTIRRLGTVAEESAASGSTIYEGDVLTLRSGRVALVRADGREGSVTGAGTWPHPEDLEGLSPEPMAPFMTRVARWLKNLGDLEKQAGGRNSGASYDPATLHVVGLNCYRTAPDKVQSICYWIDSIAAPSSPRLLLLNADRDVLGRLSLNESVSVLTNGPWRVIRSTAEIAVTNSPAFLRLADTVQGKSSPALRWVEGAERPAASQVTDHWSAGVKDSADGHTARAIDHFLHDFKSRDPDAQTWNALGLVVEDWARQSGQSRIQFAADAFFRRARGDKE